MELRPKAARELGIAVAVLLGAGAHAATPSCGAGFGVVYDEEHSFSVSAPSGWCYSDNGMFRPKQVDAGLAQPEMLVSYSYLRSTAIESHESAIQKRLAIIGKPEDARPLPPILTKKGRPLSVWSITNPQQDRYYVVAYLVQERVCLVEFRLSAASADALAEARKAFTELIATYSANI